MPFAHTLCRDEFDVVWHGGSWRDDKPIVVPILPEESPPKDELPKVCTKCKRLLVAQAFPWRNKGRKYHVSECRECAASRSRERWRDQQKRKMVYESDE